MSDENTESTEYNDSKTCEENTVFELDTLYTINSNV